MKLGPPSKRDIRRALARTVSRMVLESTRFPLALCRTSSGYELALKDWPFRSCVHIKSTGMSWLVMHEGVVWDLLMFVDCQPSRQADGWFCADPDWLDQQIYPTLDDLLFDVLARPVLNYLNRLPIRSYFQIHALDGNGVTWVQVIDACGPVFKQSTEIARWEVVV